MSVNWRNFAFNSNGGAEKIVIADERTISADEWGVFSLTVNHSLGFTPLVFGVYSIDNGTTWEDLDFFDVELHTNGGNTWASNTQYGMDCSPSTYSGDTIKVRLFGLAPMGVSPTIVPPSPLTKFYFNSRNLYDVLIFEGESTLSPNAGETTLCTHNLGYVPRVEAWKTYLSDSSTRTMRIAGYSAISSQYGTSTYQSRVGMQITDTVLKAVYIDTATGADSVKIQYKLYGRRNG